MAIAHQLREYITGTLMKDPGYQLADDEPLLSSGLIDSFSLVDLALFVEEAFSVKLHDSELNADTFDTLSALAALVESRK